LAFADAAILLSPLMPCFDFLPPISRRATPLSAIDISWLPLAISEILAPSYLLRHYFAAIFDAARLQPPLYFRHADIRRHCEKYAAYCHESCRYARGER
jgi:hypothetical protein